MRGDLTKITPYLVFILFTFIFSAGLLLFYHIPAGNPEKNSFNVHIYGPLFIVFNYDSPEFLKDANSSIELLEKTNIRQSRPGLILLAAGLNKLISPMHFQDFLYGLFKGRSFVYFTKEYLVPYFLYTLLNFLILFVSFLLFIKSMDIKTGTATGGAIVLSSLLVWNDVTKAFLFTPHTQLFNILAPLFCLYVFQRVKNQQLFDKAIIFLLAFLTGLGVTAYATFILFIPSVVISLGWNVIMEKRKVDLRMVLRLTLVLFLTVLPFLAWILYVYIQTGGFYQFEIVQYQQFVWILPLLQTAPWIALAKILVNFGVMVWLALKQSILLPLTLGLVFVISVDRDHTIQHQFGHIKKFPPAVLIVSGLFLLFFAMDGLLINRVAFTAVPPLVLGVAIVVNDILGDANHLRRGLGTAALILLVCLQCLITLSKVGPFS